MPNPSPVDHSNYASKSLTELAALAQQGEMAAFRQIVERCNQSLFRTAIAVLKDPDEAQDAVQDAYLSAYRNIRSFRGDASLLTWLQRIVLNKCYGRLRGQRPTVDVERLDAVDEAPQTRSFFARHELGDPASDTARAQIRERIEEAVMQLPDAFRVVFVLRDIEQCSVLETAEALDIRPETVKTRLFRARRLLRHSLQADLASALADAFPFLDARCVGFTDAVMTRVADVADPRDAVARDRHVRASGAGVRVRQVVGRDSFAGP